MKKLINIMREVLEDETIDTSCSQDSSENWDSLHHLNLMLELEEEFNIEFEPEEIAEMKSFEKVKEVVERKVH